MEISSRGAAARQAGEFVPAAVRSFKVSIEEYAGSTKLRNGGRSPTYTGKLTLTVRGARSAEQIRKIIIEAVGRQS